MARSKIDQETIILYSPTEDKWHVSTDVPKHIRKYLPLLENPEAQYENDEIIYIEGYLTGSVSLRKKTEMSEANKRAAAERLATARQRGQS